MKVNEPPTVVLVSLRPTVKVGAAVSVTTTMHNHNNSMCIVMSDVKLSSSLRLVYSCRR